jgi:Leucine-rich repeat (LRR) protein
MCAICRNEVYGDTVIINCYSCPNLTSLEGLEKCKALERLDCYSCPNLTSLNGIENCRALKYLDCYNCPLLVSFNCIENCKALVVLYCSYCSLLTSLDCLRGRNLMYLECNNCTWLNYKNKNYSSNIKKLKILQRSFKRSLFRRRMCRASVLKRLN